MGWLADVRVSALESPIAICPAYMRPRANSGIPFVSVDHRAPLSVAQKIRAAPAA